jgi:hypothetical protein
VRSDRARNSHDHLLTIPAAPPNLCIHPGFQSPVCRPVWPPGLFGLAPGLSPSLAPGLSPGLAPGLSPGLSPGLAPGLAPVCRPVCRPVWPRSGAKAHIFRSAPREASFVSISPQQSPQAIPSPQLVTFLSQTRQEMGKSVTCATFLNC